MTTRLSVDRTTWDSRASWSCAIFCCEMSCSTPTTPLAAPASWILAIEISIQTTPPLR